MLEKVSFDKTGKSIVCSTLDKHTDMLMDITVYKLMEGQTLHFFEEERETAILLTHGSIHYKWDYRTEKADRKDVFSEPPCCLHTCKGIGITIIAEADSEIIVQMTKNSQVFESHYYSGKDCKVELFGADQWEGTAKREVVTVFDYNNAPYSNMVIGEVITKAGRWSSYVPHSHPQPEVYYYKFEKPQGFGASFIGEEVYKITDESASYIIGGKTHPQSAAPGYNMYYCWMIRHLPNNPWVGRDVDPDHEWLLHE